MKAKLLGAAALALVWLSAPASAVVFGSTVAGSVTTVDFNFTATPDEIKPGGSVAIHLDLDVGPYDPGWAYVFFANPLSFVSFSDDAGHYASFVGGISGPWNWMFTYPNDGDYTLSYIFSGELSAELACTVTRTCTDPNYYRIRHFGVHSEGQLTVHVVPGPALGAGLPGLVLASGGLLAWWRRRQRG